MHPNYDAPTVDNDIALIKLKKKVYFGDSNRVRPICLTETGPAVNADATVTGWGTTSTGGSLSSTLREVRGHLYDMKKVRSRAHSRVRSRAHSRI